MSELNKYKAYVVPNAKVGEERKNLVLRTGLGVMLAMQETGEAFILEGERKKSWTTLNELFGGAPYKDANEFYEKLKEAVKGMPHYGFDRKLEEFADKHNLRATRLVLSRNIHF